MHHAFMWGEVRLIHFRGRWPKGGDASIQFDGHVACSATVGAWRQPSALDWTRARGVRSRVRDTYAFGGS